MKHGSSSEQLLLECLKDERARTPRELSIACQVNEPAVRYHLRKMVQMGLLEKFPDPAFPLKPGRQPDLYRLSSSSETETVYQFCRAILSHAEAALAPGDTASILAGWYLSSIGDAQFDQKFSVQELVNWLNKNHYSASWIASRSGPELIISHCPFRELQTDSDLMCRMDNAILDKLSGRTWKRNESIGIASHRGACRFELKT
jgi:predicted ArsR family transcriptional regulator